MAGFKTIQRTLTITLAGLREAVLAVAERVAARVQVGKLQLHAEDAEVRLRSAYETLGQSLYRARSVPQTPVHTTEEILPSFYRIRTEHQTLQNVRDRLATQYDELLGGALMQLKGDLQAAGGTMERVTVGPTSQAAGKALDDVPFPASVTIVAIRRGETVVFPSNGVTLIVGDHVTLVGPRSSLPAALQLLRA
jgi:K+/H+ antiporter YhaU regulatory subunit KhtT